VREIVDYPVPAKPFSLQEPFERIISPFAIDERHLDVEYTYKGRTEVQYLSVSL
jgi:hypothetical protein